MIGNTESQEIQLYISKVPNMHSKFSISGEIMKLSSVLLVVATLSVLVSADVNTDKSTVLERVTGTSEGEYVIGFRRFGPPSLWQLKRQPNSTEQEAPVVELASLPDSVG